MLENVAGFLSKKGKNHQIINVVSGGREELALCPNYFHWDCKSLVGSSLFGQYRGMSLGRCAVFLATLS